MSGIMIEKVRKSFDTKDGVVEALKDVNLNIDSGDIYGIIGMSGAGKSTLVRCMNFLEEPTEGQVLIKGRKLGSLSKKELRKQREDIGMIFQHFNLLMQRTALDNVCFPMEIVGISKKEARKKALEYLKIVGLEEKALESLLSALACQNRDTVSETQTRCLLGEYQFVHQQYVQAQEQFSWISDRAEQLEHDYDDLLNEEIREAEVLLGIMQRFGLCSER